MNFRTTEKRKVRAAVDLTPLIDVVFLLLIFFMLSATFVIQSSIQIEVPQAKGAVALEQKDLSITLVSGTGGPDNRGRVYVNNVEIESIPELSRALAAAHADRPDVMVLIRADASVQTARLVEVLGIASSVGIERYGIAAQLPAEVE
jgi:biopolymer transport protein ExbD